MTIGTPKFAKDHAVANKLQKRSLLIAVNLVAGLSIFFFGYDQGVMGGVNTNRNYAQLMGFGRWDNSAGEVVVDKPLLQGGIVSPSLLWIHMIDSDYLPLDRCLLPSGNAVCLPQTTDPHGQQTTY